MRRSVTTRGAGGRRWMRAAMVVLLGLPVMATATSASNAATAASQAPDLPAQPSVQPTPCRPLPVVGGTWQQVSAAAVNADGTVPEYHVDPGSPCRVYRAPTDQTVEASTDLGRTWQRVFHDSATGCATAALPVLDCPAQTGAFSASRMTVDSRGEVFLGERGNGDAMVASIDAGHSWHLRNTGLAGSAVEAVAWSPRRSSGYAVTAPVAPAGPQSGLAAASPLLYETLDSGLHWQANGALPDVGAAGAGVRVVSVVVDPEASFHLWVLEQVLSPATAWVFESTNSGQSFTVTSQFAGTSHQLLYIESETHVHRLFITGAFTGTGVDMMYTDDDQNWQAPRIASDPDADGALAADPNDQNRMLFVNDTQTGPQAVLSTDGFTTWRSLPLPSGDISGMRSPLGVEAFPADAQVQMDGQGSFYVALAQSSEVETLWRYAPLGSQAAPGGALLPTQWNQVPSTGQGGTPLVELAPCAITAKAVPSYGSVAYDGVDLLYTVMNDNAAGAYHAVIRRMSPACADDGVIDVVFNPGDLAEVSQQYPQGGSFTEPNIFDLTYDPRRNVVWFAVAGRVTTGGVDTGGVEARSFLFMVDITHAATHSVSARLTLRNGCGELLSYDPFDDTLWTCDASQGDAAGHLRAADGHALATCFTDVVGGTGPGVNSDGYATWAVSSADRLMLQEEDDKTLVEFTASTCQPVRSFTHRPFAEPQGEDEQMVCDPLSFSATVAGVPVHETVLWLRDAEADLITPYVLPEGACPFPTALVYSGPGSAVVGHDVVVCASLQLEVEHRSPLPQSLVSFTIAGQPAGTGVTDPTGRACVETAAPLVPGNVTVTASFAGDGIRYLPSQANGPLTVLPMDLGAGSVAAVAAVLPPPPAPPELPAPQPGPAPAPVVSHGTVPASQAQPEAQPVSQAQGMGQFGMVADRQEQLELQVAAAPETVGEGMVPTADGSSYAMSSPHLSSRDDVGTGGGIAVAFVMAGCFSLGLRWALRGVLAGTPARKNGGFR